MLNQLWVNLFYFSSSDDIAYLLGIIALLLAIIQFGLPFAEPLVLALFKNKSRSEVLNMINRILGISAFLSLWILPIFIAVFIMKFINTILLYVGLVVFNSIPIYLISAFVVGVVIYILWRFVIKRYILNPSYVLPKSDNEKLTQQVNRLANTVEQLMISTREREKQIDRLIRVLEVRGQNGYSKKRKLY